MGSRIITAAESADGSGDLEEAADRGWVMAAADAEMDPASEATVWAAPLLDQATLSLSIACLFMSDLCRRHI
jgi:hypothetical protein